MEIVILFRTLVPLSVTNLAFLKIKGHWFRYRGKNMQYLNDFRQITDRMSFNISKPRFFGK